MVPLEGVEQLELLVQVEPLDMTVDLGHLVSVDPLVLLVQLVNLVKKAHPGEQVVQEQQDLQGVLERLVWPDVLDHLDPWDVLEPLVYLGL